MTDWRTDQEMAADERATPWLLAEATIIVAIWVIGLTMALIGLARSLFQ